MPPNSPDPVPSVARGFHLDRRTFFKGAAWTAATTASGGLLYRACFGSGVPGPGLVAFTAAEFLTATAVADALFPKSQFAVSAEEADVPRYMDRYVHEMPRAKGKLFKLLLRSIEYSPAFTIDSLTRFSRLPLSPRQAVLEHWEKSRVYAQRMGHQALIFTCASGYFENDAVLQTMGWSIGCTPPPRQPGAIL
jgi:hypothetical protein